MVVGPVALKPGWHWYSVVSPPCTPVDLAMYPFSMAGANPQYPPGIKVIS